MTYACEKCIHRHPLGGCLVPSNLGYVERCKHFEEPKQTQPMTNKEYIRSCSTEELPKALKEMFFYIKSRVRSELGGYNELMKSERYFDEWLKEKHNG